MLVRDVTLGAFTPRYMPNYRIVEIHGPNRIVVRDERGNETVRRASHLKACELKDKLLLHPNDVTDLQFTPTGDGKGEIPPEVEISLINIEVNREKHDSTDLMSKSGKISPENIAKKMGINTCNEYIVGFTGDSKKTSSKISLEAAVNKESENLPKNPAWFQKPIICVSKWSKALKTGVVHSMGLDTGHTACINQEEDDKHSFSFFL